MGKPMKESYISGLDGGDGNDTISFIKAKSGVVTELNYFTLYYEGKLIEPGGAAAGERYHRNIENAIGSNYNDTLGAAKPSTSCPAAKAMTSSTVSPARIS